MVLSVRQIKKLTRYILSSAILERIGGVNYYMMLKFEDMKIDKELQELLPVLTMDEYEKLETGHFEVWSA